MGEVLFAVHLGGGEVRPTSNAQLSREQHAPLWFLIHRRSMDVDFEETNRRQNGAFVVAVFHQRDRCVCPSLDVVSVRYDGYGQLSLRPRSVHDATPDLGRSSSARRIPSAPGFTPLGETKLQRTMPAPSMTNNARSLVPSCAL